MSSIRNPQQALQFFHRSGPMTCPYRDGYVERKLFTRLPSDPVVARKLNSDLSKAGFRRSHDVIYRPICDNCSACVPVRIPVHRFRPSKSMRRTWNANRDLLLSIHSPLGTDEDYALFKGYQRSRHPDSDMAKMTQNEYRAMVEEGSVGTVLFRLRSQQDGTTRRPLIGVMVADRLDDGYSAVYSFFDTQCGRDGLGTLMIMTLVEQTRNNGLDHVYLGYWIEHSRKMAYKQRFRPLQCLSSDGWHDLSS